MTATISLVVMETTEKFSTKLNRDVLKKLRTYAKRSNKKIALIVSEALADYFDRVEVRASFKDASREVILDHRDLLRELAK